MRRMSWTRSRTRHDEVHELSDDIGVAANGDRPDWIHAGSIGQDVLGRGEGFGVSCMICTSALDGIGCFDFYFVLFYSVFLFGLVSIFCRALYMMNHGFDAVPAASQDIPGSTSVPRVISTWVELATALS